MMQAATRPPAVDSWYSSSAAAMPRAYSAASGLASLTVHWLHSGPHRCDTEGHLTSGLACRIAEVKLAAGSANGTTNFVPSAWFPSFSTWGRGDCCAH